MTQGTAVFKESVVTTGFGVGATVLMVSSGPGTGSTDLGGAGAEMYFGAENDTEATERTPVGPKVGCTNNVTCFRTAFDKDSAAGVSGFVAQERAVTIGFEAGGTAAVCGAALVDAFSVRATAGGVALMGNDAIRAGGSSPAGQVTLGLGWQGIMVLHGEGRTASVCAALTTGADGAATVGWHRIFCCFWCQGSSWWW